MAKDSMRLEQEFMATAREKTGHELAEWYAIIRAAGLEPKPNTILKWLKDEHKLNHLQANFLSGLYLNDGKPVFDHAVLFENLFADKQELLPLYRALETLIQSNLPEVELIPTKAYVSIEAARVFGCAVLAKKMMRVGLDLGDAPFDDYVQKAKSLGAMPNIQHMVEVQTPAEVNERLLGYVRQSYQQVHKK